MSTNKITLITAIQFNPKESLIKNKFYKKIPMEMLKERQRKILGFQNSKFSGGTKFRNGDTLFARITPCLENGKTAFVDILEDNEVAFGSTEFIVLRNTELTDSKFIYYLATSDFFRKKAISLMEGTSGRKRVNTKALQQFEYDFPDIKTQSKIANFLSLFDEKIEINLKINNELENLAKTIYDYWFVQFDFPDKNGNPYKSSGGEMVWNKDLKKEIPKNWEVKKLEDLMSSKRNKQEKSYMASFQISGKRESVISDCEILCTLHYPSVS
jgi:type I restriction enzyme S subunit